MNVEPILIMFAAVLIFTVVALGIGTILGVALGQTRAFFQKKPQA